MNIFTPPFYTYDNYVTRYCYFVNTLIAILPTQIKALNDFFSVFISSLFSSFKNPTAFFIIIRQRDLIFLYAFFIKGISCFLKQKYGGYVKFHRFAQYISVKKYVEFKIRYI